MPTRWKKIVRDLWQNRARTILVVFAIVIGIAGFGSVLTTYSVMNRELKASYLATNPASATLWVDVVDDNLIASARQFPGIGDVEARRAVAGRIRVGSGAWLNVSLFAVKDFNDVRISIFDREQGAWPPAQGEILIERQSFEVMPIKIGESVNVKTPHGTEQSLRIGGSVHDETLAQSKMENIVYGYVTLDTLAQLGETPTLDQLRIVVAENKYDEQHVRSVSFQFKEWLENSGHPVSRIDVPHPGEHPHADLMSGLLLFQASFGLFALLLSGVLVLNILSSIMSGQIRQIGMMKAVGARRRQVMGIYLGMALFLGGVALVIAIPMSVWLGNWLTSFLARFLNIDIIDNTIPNWVWGLEIAVGLLVPLLAAVYPAIRGSQTTVQQALNDYGVGQGTFGTSALDRLIGLVGGVTRPLLLSMRNTFRRRERLVLTLAVLAVGGMVFIAALIVRSSILNTVDLTFVAMKYNIELKLAKPYPVAQVEQAARQVPGVVQVENWSSANAALLYPDDTEGNAFSVFGPLPNTSLLDFTITEGRALRPGDRNALVVNNRLAQSEPTIKVGSDVVLAMGGKKTTWQVVGIARQALLGSAAYASYDYLNEVTGQAGYTSNVLVVTNRPDATQAAQNPSPNRHGNPTYPVQTSQETMKQSLEQNLKKAGIEVLSSTGVADRELVAEEHMDVIVTFLLIMAALIMVVGGLGLITTMSINVLERRREIGVMRAIGASNRAVLFIILGEGVLIGVLSWVFAAVFAWPVGQQIGDIFAGGFLQTNLDFVFAPPALAIWFVLVVVFAATASFLPARNASRLTVREAVAHE